MTGYVVLQALYAIAIVALSWVLSGWIAGIAIGSPSLRISSPPCECTYRNSDRQPIRCQ